MALGNGPCVRRLAGFGRCLELAVNTRPYQVGNIVYDVPLREDHTIAFDREKRR